MVPSRAPRLPRPPHPAPLHPSRADDPASQESALAPLFDTLPLVDREKQPTLFCCENDHDAVARLKERLAGRVFVVDCMVDRVCTGRTITTEGIDVSAEPWRGAWRGGGPTSSMALSVCARAAPYPLCLSAPARRHDPSICACADSHNAAPCAHGPRVAGSIVVLDPDFTGRLPFCPSVATVPRSNREAEYLSERKFTLVNGMHTVRRLSPTHTPPPPPPLVHAQPHCPLSSCHCSYALAAGNTCLHEGRHHATQPVPSRIAALSNHWPLESLPSRIAALSNHCQSPCRRIGRRSSPS